MPIDVRFNRLSNEMTDGRDAGGRHVVSRFQRFFPLIMTWVSITIVSSSPSSPPSRCDRRISEKTIEPIGLFFQPMAPEKLRYILIDKYHDAYILKMKLDGKEKELRSEVASNDRESFLNSRIDDILAATLEHLRGVKDYPLRYAISDSTDYIYFQAVYNNDSGVEKLTMRKCSLDLKDMGHEELDRYSSPQEQIYSAVPVYYPLKPPVQESRMAFYWYWENIFFSHRKKGMYLTRANNVGWLRISSWDDWKNLQETILPYFVIPIGEWNKPHIFIYKNMEYSVGPWEDRWGPMTLEKKDIARARIFIQASDNKSLSTESIMDIKLLYKDRNHSKWFILDNHFTQYELKIKTPSSARLVAQQVDINDEYGMSPFFVRMAQKIDAWKMWSDDPGLIDYIGHRDMEDRLKKEDYDVRVDLRTSYIKKCKILSAAPIPEEKYTLHSGFITNFGDTGETRYFYYYTITAESESVLMRIQGEKEVELKNITRSRFLEVYDYWPRFIVTANASHSFIILPKGVYKYGLTLSFLNMIHALKHRPGKKTQSLERTYDNMRLKAFRSCPYLRAGAFFKQSMLKLPKARTRWPIYRKGNGCRLLASLQYTIVSTLALTAYATSRNVQLVFFTLLLAFISHATNDFTNSVQLSSREKPIANHSAVASRISPSEAVSRRFTLTRTFDRRFLTQSSQPLPKNWTNCNKTIAEMIKSTVVMFYNGLFDGRIRWFLFDESFNLYFLVTGSTKDKDSGKIVPSLYAVYEPFEENYCFFNFAPSRLRALVTHHSGVKGEGDNNYYNNSKWYISDSADYIYLARINSETENITRMQKFSILPGDMASEEYIQPFTFVVKDFIRKTYPYSGFVMYEADLSKTRSYTYYWHSYWFHKNGIFLNRNDWPSGGEKDPVVTHNWTQWQSEQSSKLPYFVIQIEGDQVTEADYHFVIWQDNHFSLEKIGNDLSPFKFKPRFKSKGPIRILQQGELTGNNLIVKLLYYNRKVKKTFVLDENWQQYQLIFHGNPAAALSLELRAEKVTFDNEEGMNASFVDQVRRLNYYRMWTDDLSSIDYLGKSGDDLQRIINKDYDYEMLLRSKSLSSGKLIDPRPNREEGTNNLHSGYFFNAFGLNVTRAFGYYTRYDTNDAVHLSLEGRPEETLNVTRAQFMKLSYFWPRYLIAYNSTWAFSIHHDAFFRFNMVMDILKMSPKYTNVTSYQMLKRRYSGKCPKKLPGVAIKKTPPRATPLSYSRTKKGSSSIASFSLATIVLLILLALVKPVRAGEVEEDEEEEDEEDDDDDEDEENEDDDSNDNTGREEDSHADSEKTDDDERFLCNEPGCFKILTKARKDLHTRRHLKVHDYEKLTASRWSILESEKGVWSCIKSRCPYSTKKVASLSRHLACHFPEYKKRKCPRCQNEYPNMTSLRKHSKICTQPIIPTCNKCSKQFDDPWDLLEHLDESHRGYRCKFILENGKKCSFQYRNTSNFMKHLLIEDHWHDLFVKPTDQFDSKPPTK